jgi:fatty aldehyde-generating acyl-ACP reductase
VNGIRKPGQELLPVEKIKNIFPFLPPADLFRVNVRSKTGSEIHGAYIETFIDPQNLQAINARANLNKVIQAGSHAKKMGAAIVALGGFTSIVVESDMKLFPGDKTKFTTGNTLTAAYIVKGIEKAAMQRGISLYNSSLLIIGATGDIGMACTQYFKNKVKTLLLAARNKQRLDILSGKLKQENIDAISSTSTSELTPAADIIISVASSSGIELPGCKKHVLICDAGYPKNLEKIRNLNGSFLFHGGMGQVTGGYSFQPDYSNMIYNYPVKNIIHGCILEAMVLAFEHRYENYSEGRGNISIEKMEEIYTLGIKHGITEAPFFNSNGVCD